MGQKVLEHTRTKSILDLLLNYTHTLIQDVTIAELLSNNGHNIIRFNIPGANRVPKSVRVTLNFRKGDFNKMRNLIKNVLKLKVKEIKSSEVAWMLLKKTMYHQWMCTTELKENQDSKE